MGILVAVVIWGPILVGAFIGIAWVRGRIDQWDQRRPLREKSREERRMKRMWRKEAASQEVDEECWADEPSSCRL